MPRVPLLLAILASPLLLASPAITSVVPVEVRQGTMNVHFVVEGSGFAPDAKVTLDGVPLETAYVSPTRLRAVAQPSATERIATLLLAVSAGGESSDGMAVRITSEGPPPVRIAFAGPGATITGLTPGGQVQIHGVVAYGWGSAQVHRVVTADAEGVYILTHSNWKSFQRGSLFVRDHATDRWAAAGLADGKAATELAFPAFQLRENSGGEIIRLQSDRDGVLEHLVPLSGSLSGDVNGYWLDDEPCLGVWPMQPRPAIGTDLLFEWAHDSTWFRVTRVNELQADTGSVSGPLLALREVRGVTEDAGSVEIPVVLSAPAAVPVTIDYSIEKASPTPGGGEEWYGVAADDADFTAHRGTVTIAPGWTTATIRVALLDDERVEYREMFVVRIDNAANATIVAADSLVLIEEDDSVQITADATRIPERPTHVTLRVDRDLDRPLRSYVRILHGSTEPEDFEVREIVVEFEAGRRDSLVSLPVVSDAVKEGDERFELLIETNCRAKPVRPALLLMTIDESTRRRSARH